MKTDKGKKKQGIGKKEVAGKERFRVIRCELIAKDVTLVGGPVIMNQGPTTKDVIH